MCLEIALLVGGTLEGSEVASHSSQRTETCHLGEKMGQNMLKWQEDPSEPGVNVMMTRFIFHFSDGN